MFKVLKNLFIIKRHITKLLPEQEGVKFSLVQN